jgi:hypothetical protein
VAIVKKLKCIHKRINCDKIISTTNWSRHVKTQKHQRNDPNGDIQPRRRGRPKTKNDTDRPKTKNKPTNDVTRKQLLSQAKEYGLKGFTKLNKQQLISVLNKAKKLLLKKDDLQKLTKEELINIAKEHNIKVNLRKRKGEIIDAILKTQDSVFRNLVASELSFHDDVIEPPKGERAPPYTVTERRSRFYKKYNTTEIDYTITLNRLVEIENAIRAMFSLAKKKGDYKEGDKIYVTVSNPNFYHPISREYTNALELINHIENILSSNEHIDIAQCTFNVKIYRVPRGTKPTKIINLANDIRTKRCISQIKNNDNLCCPRAIVTALT